MAARVPPGAIEIGGGAAPFPTGTAGGCIASKNAGMSVVNHSMSSPAVFARDAKAWHHPFADCIADALAALYRTRSIDRFAHWIKMYSLSAAIFSLEIPNSACSASLLSSARQMTSTSSLGRSTASCNAATSVVNIIASRASNTAAMARKRRVSVDARVSHPRAPRVELNCTILRTMGTMVGVVFNASAKCEAHVDNTMALAAANDPSALVPRASASSAGSASQNAFAAAMAATRACGAADVVAACRNASQTQPARTIIVVVTSDLSHPRSASLDGNAAKSTACRLAARVNRARARASPRAAAPPPLGSIVASVHNFNNGAPTPAYNTGVASSNRAYNRNANAR
mmetsp:Transcript_2219/g.3052  ORF Transcript_2219/g.3052 Transcript_2219/m.3052 type:complete len:344 (-) Transcript_2219:204-1235(-)